MANAVSRVQLEVDIFFPARDPRTKKICSVLTLHNLNAGVVGALTEIVRELESMPDFDIVDRLGRVRRIKSGVERRKAGDRPVKRIR